MNIWVTKTGEKIRYSDLDPTHLINILKLYQRTLAKKAARYNVVASQSKTGQFPNRFWKDFKDEVYYNLVDGAKNRRLNLSFLGESLELYQLRAEAYLLSKKDEKIKSALCFFEDSLQLPRSNP